MYAIRSYYVRRSEHDPGRFTVSGESEDLGRMKVPSLRNVGLRKHYMHTGEFATAHFGHCDISYNFV